MDTTDYGDYEYDSATGLATHNDLVCDSCNEPWQGEADGWCLKCGYYPRFGTFVELDSWDAEEDEAETAPNPQTTYAAAFRSIPYWVWTLLGITLVIFAMSVAVRLSTTPESSVRLWWAISQLAFGLTLFGAMHLWSYLLTMTEDARFGVLDVVMRPIAVWWPAFTELPSTLPRVALGCTGFMAACCVLVIGPHLEYDFEPPQKADNNLVKSIAQAAASQETEGDADDLEGAIEDFTGKGTGMAQPPGEEQKQANADLTSQVKANQTPEDKWLQTDCLVVGYIPSADNPESFRALILATKVGSQLKYVGQLREGFSSEQKRELLKDMLSIGREFPFVPADGVQANWIEPRIMLRVKFVEWDSHTRIVFPKLQQRLVDLD